jgi:CheY-like chemotaxis protein
VHALILALHEDEKHSANVVESLEKSGHTVLLRKNFNDAIDVLKDTHVDLIISDVHLQNGGNVFDFVRWVKDNPETSQTPFVMFSSDPTPMAKFFDDGLRTSARLLGVALYLTMDKFDGEQFGQQINSLLASQSQSQSQSQAQSHKDNL